MGAHYHEGTSPCCGRYLSYAVPAGNGNPYYRGGANMSITVFLADDHRMVREGFRLLLETQSDIKVIGEAGNGREAVRQAIKLAPDVILMDIAMPELNGIEATKQIIEARPSA